MPTTCCSISVSESQAVCWRRCRPARPAGHRTAATAQPPAGHPRRPEVAVQIQRLTQRRPRAGGIPVLRRQHRGGQQGHSTLRFIRPFDIQCAYLRYSGSGEPDQAALLAPWLEPGHEERLTFFHPVLPSIVRLCLTAGDEAGAQAAVAAARQEADRDPPPSQWCHGLVRGDPEVVLTAAGSLVNSRRPLLVGNAFEDAAVLLARAGTTAPSALGEALEVYGQIGASWDARRAGASSPSSRYRLARKSGPSPRRQSPGQPSRPRRPEELGDLTVLCLLQVLESDSSRDRAFSKDPGAHQYLSHRQRTRMKTPAATKANRAARHPA
jgi:hypothetical protein